MVRIQRYMRNNSKPYLSSCKAVVWSLMWKSAKTTFPWPCYFSFRLASKSRLCSVYTTSTYSSWCTVLEFIWNSGIIWSFFTNDSHYGCFKLWHWCLQSVMALLKEQLLLHLENCLTAKGRKGCLNIFGRQKNCVLWGCHFTLCTDHSPLSTLLSTLEGSWTCRHKRTLLRHNTSQHQIAYYLTQTNELLIN